MIPSLLTSGGCCLCLAVVSGHLSYQLLKIIEAKKKKEKKSVTVMWWFLKFKVGFRWKKTQSQKFKFKLMAWFSFCTAVYFGIIICMSVSSVTSVSFFQTVQMVVLAVVSVWNGSDWYYIFSRLHNCLPDSNVGYTSNHKFSLQTPTQKKNIDIQCNLLFE